jgi:hypothetical protein
MAIPFLACMSIVATFYGLPPRVLPAIQAVEGGAPGVVHRNVNGTDDFGVMQVNSVWVAPLSSYTHLDRSIVRRRLMDNACFNIAAAGLILRSYIHEAGGNLMQAIGYYHSHTPELGARYQMLVRGSASLLFTRPDR